MQRFRLVCSVKKIEKSYLFFISFFVFFTCCPFFLSVTFSSLSIKTIGVVAVLFLSFGAFAYKCQNFTELFVSKFQNAYSSFFREPFFYSIFMDFARFSTPATSFVNAELHHFKTVFQQVFSEFARSFALRLRVCR